MRVIWRRRRLRLGCFGFVLGVSHSLVKPFIRVRVMVRVSVSVSVRVRVSHSLVKPFITSKSGYAKIVPVKFLLSSC